MVEYERSRSIDHEPFSFYGKQVGEIFKGTYGTVYLYKKMIPGKPDQLFAIKNGIIIEYNDLNFSFLREIAIMRRLSHSNIAELIDYDIYNMGNRHGINMIMPSAKMDLYVAITSGYISEDKKREVVYQIVRGMEYYLSRDIIHRDIKPRNILVYSSTGDVNVKITDFGISKFSVCSHEGNKTAELFSVPFRPPEVFLAGDYDKSGDIWSLGCLIYFIYTGKSLFSYCKGPPFEDEQILRDIFDVLGDPVENWKGITNLPLWGLFIEKPLFKTKFHPAADGLKWPDPIPDDVAGLILTMVKMNPSERMNPTNVLRLPFFDSVRKIIERRLPEPKFQAHSRVEILDMRSQSLTGIHPRLMDPRFRWTIIVMSEWLYEVTRTLKISLNAFYLAIHLMRLHHNSLSLTPDHIKLLGVSFLNIAHTAVDKFLSSTDMLARFLPITEKEVRDKSLEILKIIEFDIIQTTSYDYLVTYTEFSDPIVRDCAKDILLISLYLDLSDTLSAKQIAQICVLLASQIQGVDFKHSLEDPSVIKSVYSRFLQGVNTNNFAKKVLERSLIDIDDFKFALVKNMT